MKRYLSVLIASIFVLSAIPVIKTEAKKTEPDIYITRADVSSSNLWEAYGKKIRESQELVDKASAEDPVCIKFEPGDYTSIFANRGLISNAIYDFTGCHFTCTTDCVNIITNDYNVTDGSTSYHKTENVTIIGGDWDMSGEAKKAAGNKAGSVGFRISNASNIELDGVTIRNPYAGHHMEFAAVDGLRIKNCTFEGMVLNRKNDALEALQLDVFDENFSDLYSSGGRYSCKNVEVSGCTFKDVVRGVGSHRLEADKYDSISIHDNTFEGIDSFAINAYGWNNSSIYNNSITGSESGIEVWGKCENTTISDNKIYSPNKYGICINKKNQGDDSPVIGSIKNNTIDNSGDNGIVITGGAKVAKIEANTITKPKKYGISVQEKSNIKSINKNTIRTSSDNSITLAGGSTIGTCDSNKIYDCKNNGISLTAKVKVNSISGNTILRSKRSGINVTTSSVKKMVGNTVKNAKHIGISINTKSVVKKYNKNTLKKNKKNQWISPDSTVNGEKGK